MPIAYTRIRANHRHLIARKTEFSSRSGQSIIESCLVLGLICVVFMTMLNVAELTAAREVLSYAAACSARSRTVGFNQFMVWKTGRIASIPNAGKMIVPEYINDDPYLRQQIASRKPGELFVDMVGAPPPASGQYQLEQARIPEYMDAGNMARAEYVLNYSAWDSIVIDPGQGEIGGDGSIPQMLHATASQDYTNWFPLHKIFYNADVIHLQASSDIESHYTLYIDDKSY
ncbi:MAG: hypothetical protein A2283_23120 [Lentisphaerae bacterium RIFOXYA12_FULL_48_11]|nr:MAG: hypothetical protein A2283_23120 [Lentisphaerae bacterium RIFOXYA12_FULL_48_11]